MRPFRYGIEHELALVHPDGSFADFTDVAFETLQAVIAALPEDPADYPDLRVGDQGIKRKRWYVEGYERFDEDGGFVRCDPKGIEIRTRIHDSVGAAVDALAADVARLDAALLGHGVALRTTAIGFNPLRREYPIEPPLNAWEREHRLGSPEERTAHLHMTTYGPDLNLSCADLDPTALVDVGRKLTHYSPWLVPLSFSSPFRDGVPWGGLSARTHVRTGVRPAALVFLGSGDEQVAADPSLTQVARLPAEIGRIEFKAFDACPDLALYGELLSLLTGLVLDETLPGRRTTPDTAAHQHVARRGLHDDATHAGTGALLDAAAAALDGRPDDLARLDTLRGRWARRECPAVEMLARHGRGEPVAGVPPARPHRTTVGGVTTQITAESAGSGEFVRQPNRFRERITADGSSGWPAEPGRYRLIVSLACPWAHRSVIVRKLLGLEEAIPLAVVDPIRDERGWRFTLDDRGRDPVLGIEYLSEAYLATDPGYGGRVTVPAIVEVASGRVVTNDYPQITLDLSTQWRAHHRPDAPDLYPEDLRAEIDAVNADVYRDVNNGVYRCGFATSQAAYEQAYAALWNRLDALSERLAGRRYLVGDRITEADVRLFTTLVRFDAVYHNHFKANRQKITEMPVLWAYARDLFQTPGFGETVDLDHIKRHYYGTHHMINPSGVVPVGPDPSGWLTPHGRG